MVVKFLINIGGILRNERRKNDKTQQQVADALNISRAQYADIERNRYTPRVELLAKLAIFFDIDLNFLKESLKK